MCENEIKRILAGGIDHYDFKRIIFSEGNRAWLDNISFIEIKEIVNSIKDNSIALYTFLPFCYIFLGIDLMYYYNQQLNNEWKDCPSCASIANDFERYPIKLHYEKELEDYLEKFEVKKYTLNQIRINLIAQGAKPVEFLETIGGIKIEF